MPFCFVATDADGLQHHDGYRRMWPLPVPEAEGWLPGEVVGKDEHGEAVVFSADELLDALGERIYAAEILRATTASPSFGRDAMVRLTAAMFALDCVEHVLEIVPGSAEAELPGGGTLGPIIASARQYLADSALSDTHKLGLVSRIAAARRLRRESAAIGDAAFTRPPRPRARASTSGATRPGRPSPRHTTRCWRRWRRSVTSPSRSSGPGDPQVRGA